ncbi:MAG: FHA domain-containing protein [Scytonematopsis contorta HA4267-MV1]|jgi:pSer/pThr/pTyr-binding forkhead associated (FHA) protein|nr:FHA domain-containing protein [Scytonematopsis contorta HA4267-MV1]
MEIRFIWEDPANQERQQQDFGLPLVIGRELARLPENIQGQPPAKVCFKSKEISGYHALIDFVDGQLIIEDVSTNGTRVNGKLIRKTREVIGSGDTLQFGPFQITLTVLSEVSGTEILDTPPTEFNPDTVVSIPSDISEPLPSAQSTIFFNPETDEPEAQKNPAAVTIHNVAFFPPAEFLNTEFVDVQLLYASGNRVEEKDYLGLGGGIGSFVWTNYIRIYGVKADKIAVLGLEKKPYGRYQRLCKNSQIPPYERLRSGSDSCPDNIWGWPGYAWREAWRELFSGQVISAAKHLWQVFSEPVLADTYTPISGKVFESLDREAERIGWSEILRYGRIRAIRKTTDGRYAVAYSVPGETQRVHGYLVGKFVHIATGYPAVRFLPDLQKYRLETGDFKSVVNAYEEHHHIYEYLERNGGTVVLRGRGIVSSRIVQRLSEARRKNPKITVIHVMRTPVLEGNKFGPVRRKVENHWEFQPYNWPKGTWGGDMRALLEASSPAKRYELLKDWGGTTTADRTDWKRIVQDGLDKRWYNIEFGEVEKVEANEQGKPTTFLKTNKGTLKVAADFVIDSTGLEAKPKENPLFADLIDRYNIALSPYGGLNVANDFEIKEMRNNSGRMYVSGILTLGGPYAAIDTFLGLQYAAQRIADGLVASKAPGMRYINPFGSLWQWIKWATNQKP